MWLRMLVSQVVKQAAEEQVKKLLTEGPAASGAMSNATEEPRRLEPEELRADAFLVFGSRAEAAGWIDHQSSVSEWPIEHGRLVKSTVGNVTCMAWIQSNLESRAAFGDLLNWVQPRLILLAGFAIGLSPDVSRGTLVIGQSVSAGTGEDLQSPLVFDSGDSPSKGLRMGKLITVSKPPEAGAERKSLFEKTQALAADPDAFDGAKAASDRGYPWIAVRAVTEAWDHFPSIQLKSLLEQGSLTGKIGVAVGSLLQEPKSAGELWKIQEDAIQASDRLAKFLKSFVAGLA